MIVRLNFTKLFVAITITFLLTLYLFSNFYEVSKEELIVASFNGESYSIYLKEDEISSVKKSNCYIDSKLIELKIILISKGDYMLNGEVVKEVLAIFDSELNIIDNSVGIKIIYPKRKLIDVIADYIKKEIINDSIK